MIFIRSLLLISLALILPHQAFSDTLYGLKDFENPLEIAVFNLQQKKQTGLITSSSIAISLSATPSGSEIYTMPEDAYNNTDVVNTKTNTITRTITDPDIFPGGGSPYTRFNFQETEKKAFFPAEQYSTSKIGLGILDSSTYEIIDFAPLTSNDYNIVFNIISPDEKSIYLSTLNNDSDQPNFYIFDIASKTFTSISLDSLGSYLPYNGIFSSDGSKIYIYALKGEDKPTQGKVTVFDINTQIFEILDTVTIAPGTSFSFSPFIRSLDGGKVFLSAFPGTEEALLYTIDTATNAFTLKTINQVIFDITLSSDGSVIYFSSLRSINDIGIYALDTKTLNQTSYFLSTSFPLAQIVIVGHTSALNSTMQYLPLFPQKGMRKIL